VDPDVTQRELIDALARQDWTAALEHAATLRAWTTSGGFAPERLNLSVATAPQGEASPDGASDGCGADATLEFLRVQVGGAAETAGWYAAQPFDNRDATAAAMHYEWVGKARAYGAVQRWLERKHANTARRPSPRARRRKREEA
jgi:hypothetical protein